MNDPALRRHLGELRREVAHLSEHDPAEAEVRRHIEGLIGGLEHHLDAPGDAPSDVHRARLNERLEAAIDQFEATHPTLTLRLNEIMMTLSGTGV